MLNFFDPLIGGLLIGISAVLMMLLLGRITGISGIFFGALSLLNFSDYSSKEHLWRWLFIFGLPLGVWISIIVFGHSPPANSPPNLALVITSGFLVGVGTKLGSGCTSGHGVCGISRFSKRSIIATLTFMLSGITTVFVVNLIRGTL